MRNIEDQLRQAANKDGRSILALSRDAEIGYQSIWAFVRGRGSLNLGSASRLAAALGLELRPIIERKGR